MRFVALSVSADDSNHRFYKGKGMIIPESYIPIITSIVKALLIFIGSILIAKMLRKALVNTLQNRKIENEGGVLLGQLLYWSILSTGVIIALQQLFDVSAFLTGLGILGFTLGFALQDITQNFVAGIILLIQQPFDLENFVSISNYQGTIKAIHMRTTEMKTLDGRFVIIPNAQVLSNPIENYSRAETLRVDIPVGVSYDTELNTARTAILEVLPEIKGYLADPEPLIIYDSFGASSIDMIVGFWISTSENNIFDAKDEAVVLIKHTLDEAGVDIPFPITTVHIQK